MPNVSSGFKELVADILEMYAEITRLNAALAAANAKLEKFHTPPPLPVPPRCRLCGAILLFHDGRYSCSNVGCFLVGINPNFGLSECPRCFGTDGRHAEPCI